MQCRSLQNAYFLSFSTNNLKKRLENVKGAKFEQEPFTIFVNLMVPGLYLSIVAYSPIGRIRSMMLNIFLTRRPFRKEDNIKINLWATKQTQYIQRARDASW